MTEQPLSWSILSEGDDLLLAVWHWNDDDELVFSKIRASNDIDGWSLDLVEGPALSRVDDDELIFELDRYFSGGFQRPRYYRP